MNCKYHNNLKGTNTCSVCGEWICESCVLDINDRIYCKDCLKYKLKNDTSTKYTNKPIYKSDFITFILSFLLPGTAQIYLGYTKRGLFILAFWLLGFNVDMLSILMWLSYIFGIFDAFKLKRNLEKGIYQEDSICDVKKFLCENKFFILVLIIIMAIPIFKRLLFLGQRGFSYVFHLVDHFFIFDILGVILSIIAIVLLINFFKNKKSNKKNIDDKQ